MIKIVMSLLLASAAIASGVNRYALIVGANYGGKSREVLRYAVSDGEMVSRVLGEMGGLNPSNLEILKDPTPKALLNKIREISSKVNKEKTSLRSEFIFYYSGHADGKGLQLGENYLDYKDLKKEIDGVATEVRIAILDACASGAMTRLKGGVRKQAFLAGNQMDLKGYAILTSSSESEASQESDQIGGSFFTHYLVSGLRGAADASNDGKVTLNEAYEYAYQQTLLRTSRSKGGVQHPNYDMKLSGSGEIVMTDLRRVEAGLILPENLNGRFFVKNEKGHLVAEIAKENEQSYQMGLAKGNYELVRLNEGMLSHMRFDLNVGDVLEINEKQLVNFSPERTSIRGNSADDYIRDTQADDSEEKEVVLGFSDLLFNKNTSPTVGLQFSLLGNYAHRRHRGWQVSIFTNIAMEEVHTQLTTGVNVAMGEVHGWQISALANFNGSMWSKSSQVKDDFLTLNGLQLAGSFNYAEKINGVQLSGTGNGVFEINGAQLSGFFNVARDVNGTQISGGTNIVDQIRGAQLTGAFNFADEITGTQLAVVNVADTIRGFQLGIFNYANYMSGVSLGLFNYVGNGLLAFRNEFDETGIRQFTLVSGSSMLYMEYILGGYPDRGAPALGLGLGSRIFNSEYLNIHTSVEVLHVFEREVKNTEDWKHNQEVVNLKSQVGFKPFKDWFEVFVGVKYSMALVEKQGYLLESAWWGKPMGNDKIKHWPGLFAGVSIGRI